MQKLSAVLIAVAAATAALFVSKGVTAETILKTGTFAASNTFTVRDMYIP
jgi:hypothetical protein